MSSENAQITWDAMSAIPPFSPADGVKMHLMAGEQLMVNLVVMQPGATVPIHSHTNEQAGYIVKGALIMTIDGETRTLGPGECYLAPGNVSHGATSGSDGCEIVDIFAPPRPDYVAAAQQAREESTR